MNLRNLTTLSIGALAAITLAACGDNEVETTAPAPAETSSMGAMTLADPMTPTAPAMTEPAMPADGMTPPPVNDPAAMDPAATSPAT